MIFYIRDRSVFMPMGGLAKLFGSFPEKLVTPTEDNYKKDDPPSFIKKKQTNDPPPLYKT